MTFKNNRGRAGAAIYIDTEINQYYTKEGETFEESSVTFPDDTVFMDNLAEVSCMLACIVS